MQIHNTMHIALVHQWQYPLLHWRPCSSQSPCYHCTDLLPVHHSHHPHLLNGVAAGGLTAWQFTLYIFIWHKLIEAKLANSKWRNENLYASVDAAKWDLCMMIHISFNFLASSLASCWLLAGNIMIFFFFFLQRPSWLRHTAEIMRKGFKKSYKWWATVELGRRMLLLLSVVPFPGKNVSSNLDVMHIPL